jgi:phosphoribosylamine-glycine ligase
VLIEDTGFSDHFPTGKGVLVFQNIEEAVAGVAEIDANYQLHSKAAREFAEEFLDSRKYLTAMLDACDS